MKVTDIIEKLESDWEEKIQSVLDNKELDVKLPFARPNDVIKIIEKLGGEECDDFDSNGWQWDYWMTFTYKDNKYCLSGDGWFQHYARFNKEL